MYNTPSEIIAKVGSYLREPMGVDNIKQLEMLRVELIEKKNDWLQLLYEKRNQMLYPTEKGKTELDRRVMLNASVAQIERDYNFLLDLDRLVEQRIDLFKLLTK